MIMMTMIKNFKPLKIMLEEKGFILTEQHEANIGVSEKNDFFIYNYNNNVLVPRDDEIIRMCRGLVLNKNGKIMNFPFKRFFNFHEPECDEVDIYNADILEKLDGSLISVWRTGSQWEVTTRGSFYPNKNSHNFKETFLRLFDKLHLLPQDSCWMFELISKDNRIVTKYDHEKVVLIGGRNMTTLKEESQDVLDIVAKEIGVDRPRRFKATNIDECRELFNKMNDDEEGLVVVDKNFNRFKIKQESYLKMAKIVSMKGQDILDYILGRTDIDADFADMNELKDKINEVNKMYNSFKIYCEKIYKNIKHIRNQKEFASHALNYKISGILFKMKKGINVDNLYIRWDKIQDIYNSIIMPSHNILIVLRGVPGSGKSSWVKENEFGIYTLCADTLRLMYSAPNPYISQEHNNRIWELLNKVLEIRMNNGDFTIIDATHCTERSLSIYKKLCETYNYEMKIVDFDITLEEALERNKNREAYKKVPEDVITKMYKQKIQTFINNKNI